MYKFIANNMFLKTGYNPDKLYQCAPKIFFPPINCNSSISFWAFRNSASYNQIFFSQLAFYGNIHKFQGDAYSYLYHGGHFLLFPTT